MQPRERFALHGPGVFGDDELLALIIGTGSKARGPVEIARSLLEAFGSLAGIADAEIGEITPLHGLGPARAVRLKAALVAGRRSLLSADPRPIIQTADEAWAQLCPHLAGQPRESLAALYLSHSHRLLALRVLTTGSDRHTIVDPRQVFRPAVRSGAAGVIIAHNHPSGDPTASSADLSVTRQLAEAGRVVGVELLDHLILGAGQYVSLAEQGALVRPTGWRAGPLRE